MRRVLALALVVVMIAAMLPQLTLPAAAESLYIRKIVSVVYDDSGSMNSRSKWDYANYAMQAFCGMLNSEDQLYITYMRHTQTNANYQPEKIDLSAGGIQNSVDAIRAHTDSGGTPYNAVEIAYEKLKNVPDSNPNTQYWLVVITDGEFDKCDGMSEGEKKNFLNQNFQRYAESVMPNGTNPQVTFLGIGDVVAPDENLSKGIFTYAASNAKGIIGAMSQMADRISGRTRLQQGDIQLLDDHTIQVSSAIPLLNIAVFAQGSEAQIADASYNDERPIPISRKALLSYPGQSALVGGAYLLGDAQTVIGAGTYKIRFDQKVALKDVVVLFEPALEMRMTVSLNGKQLADYSELDQAMAGDKISVSCKIYEMGTETQISPDLLPPETKFGIIIKENGRQVAQSDGKEMLLSEHFLQDVKTEITASVVIAGFNPINTTIRFTPTKYVPRVVYSMTADYGGATQSVKFDEIANNQDLTVCFTVLADGVPLTDPDAVQALKPVVQASPQGNGGMVTYSEDGKIIFTPNTASMTASGDGKFTVDVTCTLEDGTNASLSYTVLIAAYQVVGVDATQPVEKIALYGNQTGVSFYITKDGVKMSKAEVEQGILVKLNEDYANLDTTVTVAPDGTITVIPYSPQQRDLGFLKWKWLINWAYYWFKLPSSDISVTLTHPLGTAQGTIDVVKANIGYLIVQVWLPLLICLYVLRCLTRRRFKANQVLYVGDISWRRDASSGTNYHMLSISAKRLKKYNRFWYQLNPFRRTSAKVNGVRITALGGGKIRCNEPQPWYTDRATDLRTGRHFATPAAVVEADNSGMGVKIEEIKPGRIVADDERTIPPCDTIYYCVAANIANKRIGANLLEVIDDATIFCYTTE